MGNKLAFLFSFFLFFNFMSFADSQDGAGGAHRLPPTSIKNGYLQGVSLQQNANQCDAYSTSRIVDYDIYTDEPQNPPDGNGIPVSVCICNLARPGENTVRHYRLDRPYDPNFCPRDNLSRTTSCKGASSLILNGDCQCDYAFTANGTPERFSTEDQSKNNENYCPQSSPTASNEAFACIQQLEKNILACNNLADETVQTCDEKSEKNAQIRNTMVGASQKVEALLQAKAAQGGGAESCRQAGLVSNTAGYGAGMINQNCDKEIQKCQSSCSQYSDYSDPNKIISSCLQNGGTQVLVTQEKFKEKAQELASMVKSTDVACAAEDQGSTRAGALLKSSSLALASFINGSKQAAACQNALLANSNVVPLSLGCALGQTTAGCPSNCVTNPGDPGCKITTGTDSKLSTIASKGTPPAGLSLGNSNFAGKSTDLGNLDLGDDSGMTDGSSKPTANVESAAMFGSAQQAAAGSAGSTTAAEKKGETNSSENYEDRGFFSGTFNKMKSAANSFMGGVNNSFFKSNKDKATENSKNVNAMNKKTSVIRGLANNGGTCFVDSKGVEFCFGRKNMDIFQMMSKQYGQQKHKKTFFGDL